MRSFHTFIGVDLGGGKGKNTAVARLQRVEGGVQVVDFGTGGDAPWYDDRLLEYLREYGPDSVVAVDAPLTLPNCVRCPLTLCPGTDTCEVPIVAWFRNRENGARIAGHKPKYTPYTQRASEVLLYEDHQIMPRETLGQGMGPLTARATYLTRALLGTHVLNQNLIEVYPKATLAKLFPDGKAKRYKRSAEAPRTRLEILRSLEDLTFAPPAWREHAVANDHKFDAIICAYTAYLWWRGRCHAPSEQTIAADGWIWFPNLTPIE